MKRAFGLIGGDRRQAELAKLLASDGHTVYTYGLDGRGGDGLARASSAETVILPLPLCRGDGVLNCPEAPMPTRDLFRRFRPEQRLLAGQVRPQQRREAEELGLGLEDYFLREELTVANAAATAEGAIQTAMEQLDRSLLGMRCLVVGFGRIGKLLAFRLHGLGARVTATARTAGDLAWIRAYGYDAARTGGLGDSPETLGAVFNTVPAPVLGAEALARLAPSCLLVELASAEGIDPAAAGALGLTLTTARSLPGRLAPVTAAEAIRSAVYHILEE